MPLYKYENYTEYKKIQVQTFKKKESHVWAKKSYIERVVSHLTQHSRAIAVKGLCHGTRNGKEQEWFRSALKAQGIEADVIGTEIAESAAETYPHTIAWDFHDVKGEWLSAMDFIYSNALDHSYKPKECIAAWLSCLRPEGVCVIEWSTGHIPVNKSDPFGVTFGELEELLQQVGEIKDVLCIDDSRRTSFYFVTQS
jgi:hypothetical protein